MELDQALGDGETEPGTAFGPALRHIHAVKTFGQPRQMLGRDAGREVAHGHRGLAGAGVMLTGVFDHRLFVQTFGPPRVIDYENGDVAAH